MINKSILSCAVVSIGISWLMMADWAAWITTMAIICLAVALLAIFAPETYFGTCNNDDIYDKDFTSLDDVPKPVVKIDEHC